MFAYSNLDGLIVLDVKSKNYDQVKSVAGYELKRFQIMIMLFHKSICYVLHLMLSLN